MKPERLSVVWRGTIDQSHLHHMFFNVPNQRYRRLASYCLLMPRISGIFKEERLSKAVNIKSRATLASMIATVMACMFSMSGAHAADTKPPSGRPLSSWCSEQASKVCVEKFSINERQFCYPKAYAECIAACTGQTLPPPRTGH